MTRNQKIRLLLAESESTCHEIADLLSIPFRDAQVGVWVLTSQGHAEKTGRQTPGDRGCRRNLYRLTRRGMEAVTG